MKKNYLWKWLAVMMVATLGIFITSCKEDEDPVLIVDRTSLSFDANGKGSNAVNVTAKYTDWNIMVTDGGTWLSVSKNGQTAVVTVQKNSTTAAREGKFAITATADASLRYEITVTQTGAEGTISVNTNSVEFDSNGGSQTITVTSNMGWNISGNQGWLSVDPSSSGSPSSSTSGSKTIVLTATENTSNEPRNCTLNIITTDGKATAKIVVSQKKTNPSIQVNGLNNTTLHFDSHSGVNYKQTVKVTSNVSWTMSGCPEWLSVSPMNGKGEINVDIYPKTDNNSSDKERSAQLVLSSGDVKAIIKIVQDSGLDPEAHVIPTNIVTLYNGIAFDFDFGKNVSYYYRGYLEKSLVATMTDAEIIAQLEENFSRHTITDEPVAAFSGLDEGISYMIYTVGYNNEGVRGKLYKTEFTTKARQNNEPIAWIGDPTTDGKKWYWDITKSATCYSYYMIVTEDYEFALKSDVYQAWIIKYMINKGELSEYVNGGSWNCTKDENSYFFAVMTWGLDKHENFANEIAWNYSVYGEYMPKKDYRAKKKQKEDKNYPIVGMEKIKIIKMKQ